MTKKYKGDKRSLKSNGWTQKNRIVGYCIYTRLGWLVQIFRINSKMIRLG